MAVEIGSKYRENLARLKNYLLSIKGGGLQEDLEIDERKGKGMCYYDCCPVKEDSAERAIYIFHGNGNVESYFFHSFCISDLLADDLSSVN